MGLAKTILSPLTNTTPLVSIILVIILVAIFRFSGGGISVGDKNLTANSKLANNANLNENKKDEFPREGTIKINANEFEQMMKLRPPKKQEKAKDDGQKHTNDFDSIEAELGLR